MKNKPKKQPDNFKALQAQWYKKLEKSGFVDIENTKGTINSGLPKRLRTKDVDHYVSVTEYFRVADEFLNNHQFDNRLEEIIWEYHTSGLSIREIVDTLKKVRRPRSREFVWQIIKRLRTEMYDTYVIK